ncbi:SANT/Myb_domain [Hexamita inflata]|uniref:SANT/Myb domain n=1 Tax=Hexamita inflata TaxID=28002 RepID=A0AA86UPJ5_9EUKA|nr:SANT/Myb domain [Hexamita inflata]CAI9966640.1 SANT/Myb domain [Hexamita inflata]
MQTQKRTSSKRSWSHAEQNLFKKLYKQFRKNFELYVPFFEGRTHGQIKSFYQNVVHKNKQISAEKTVNVSSVDSQVQCIENVGLNVFESTMMIFDNQHYSERQKQF